MVVSKAIIAEAEKTVVVNSVVDLKVSVETMKNNLDLVANGVLVHFIHYKIEKIVNKFDVGRSLFRKYPYLAAETLVVTGALFNNFYPILKSIDVRFAVNSKVACTLTRVLAEYSQLYVYYRLLDIDETYSILGANCGWKSAYPQTFSLYLPLYSIFISMFLVL